MKIYKVKVDVNDFEDYFKHEEELELKDEVIIDTEKGIQLGKIIKIENQKNKDKNYDNILRIATKKEKSDNLKNIKDAEKALNKAQELANDLGLEMKFAKSYFTLDKKQLVLTFTADSRIDFRELAKELAGIYKTRIELRQIGIRDKAKEISGLGQCGRKLCCSNFLNNLESVSINMVKNQNLSLNPNKINGQCGRLLCCLTYENDEYSNCRKKMPKMGEIIKSDIGEAKVTNLDVLNLTYTVTNEEGNELEIKACDKCGNNK